MSFAAYGLIHLDNAHSDKYSTHPIKKRDEILRRAFFIARCTVASEALGQFQGEPIPAWIESQGQRYVFQRASQDGPRTKLGRDEVLYEGRLVYVRDGAVHLEA